MTAPGKHLQFRITVMLSNTDADRAALDMLGLLAAETPAEILGLFMEDIELLSLADLPVALSSELDDVSKKNYALNKSVRAVKKKCAQIDEMRAEIQQLQKKVATMEKKLANENFTLRAPAEVVQQQRDKLAKVQRQLASVESSLAKLAK